jgi:hypothetical protein
MVHDVIVIGDRLYDDSGDVIGTHGFYVDVTDDGRSREDLVNAAVAEWRKSCRLGPRSITFC